MKILIVGAGAVGSVISRFLVNDKGVSSIICASKDLKRSKEFIDIRNKKIKLLMLDASDVGRIIKIAKGVDLIINACLPRFNENILEAALKVGANYQDLASEFSDLKTAEQLKFNQRFKKAKLVGLINTGVAPGITNLLAKEAAEKFNKIDRIEKINIRLIEEQKASEMVFSWSAETVLADMALSPLLYKNKKFVFTEPFGNSEEYDFPSPFGKRRIFNIYGDEVATLPLYIKTDNVDFKSAGADIDFFRALYRLGLLSQKPLIVDGKTITPVNFFKKIVPEVPTPKEMMSLMKKGIVENAFLVLIVEVIGREAGKNIMVKKSIIFPDLNEISKRMPGATYVSYPAGIAAYIFSKATRDLKTYGVFPPEALDLKTRESILLELVNNGIIAEEQLSRM